MGLTSNKPAAERVARCSSTTDVYQTGMSQPAKGTILAPSLRCVSNSAVRRRGESVASFQPKAGRLVPPAAPATPMYHGLSSPARLADFGRDAAPPIRRTIAGPG